MVKKSISEAERQRRINRSRKGGLATKAKYGREHFVRLGKMGGRPTWEEALDKARAQAAARKPRRGRPPRESNEPEPTDSPSFRA